MSTSGQHFAPGAYKFTVKTTEEAVALIREKLGPTARVLSVRAIEAKGLKKLFHSPRLEVIAQVDPISNRAVEPEITEASAPRFDEASTEPAAPDVPATNERGPYARLVPLPSNLGLTGLLRRSGITETALNRL